MHRCQTCGALIKRPPYKRAGDRSLYCSLRCAGQARRVVHPDELMRIAAARECKVSWGKIAGRLGVTLSSIQRALRRAGVPIQLPRWVRREAPYRGDSP